jgi:hypothetical protein
MHQIYQLMANAQTGPYALTLFVVGILLCVAALVMAHKGS